MLVWMILFAPEPKGLSLEEIEVVFHGPLVVTNLNYEEYLQSHRDEIERIRKEVDHAAAGGGKYSDNDVEKLSHTEKDSASFSSEKA